MLWAWAAHIQRRGLAFGPYPPGSAPVLVLVFSTRSPNILCYLLSTLNPPSFSPPPLLTPMYINPRSALLMVLLASCTDNVCVCVVGVGESVCWFVSWLSRSVDDL
ncbi:hypothetical protein C2E23DRAFT_822953 [Lenzites betulinus]|nr:hypothetical protein C2E23DRAFT_822953 [Lenzites betulinus]